MMVFVFLLAQGVPNALFPYPELMAKAEEQVLLARSMFSDYPELYRLTWSFALAGRCEPLSEPCSFDPFLPPALYTVPVSLWTHYQELVYTPPLSPDKRKAALALSHVITLYGSGIQWRLTVNAEGIKHDLMYCEYKVVRRRIEIAPLVFLRVNFLKPARYHHITVKASGTYNLQTHELKQWQVPLSAGMQRLMFDVQEVPSACGTSALVYTSQPGEVLMDLFGGLSPDAATLGGADQQILITPKLGTRTCGEYSFDRFVQFMTHRGVETPAFFHEGPPLEVWSFQEARDASAPTAAVLDPDTTVDHHRMKGVKDDLAELGLQGRFNQDANMALSLAQQAEREDARYKQGSDLGLAALSLLDFLRHNPQNDQLWELYQQFVGPHIHHIEWMNDTEIEFDPTGPHCLDEQGRHLSGYLGHVPILGQHFFPDLEACRFCGFHDLIVRQPDRGWSFRRLIDMAWQWGKIHGPRGHLREQAHAFVQRVMLVDLGRPPRATLHDLQQERAAHQRVETHQGRITGPDLVDLEGVPSGTTPNTTRSQGKDQIPVMFLEPFEPCMDPSWTAEYLLLFGEIDDLLDLPCALLWGVEP